MLISSADLCTPVIYLHIVTAFLKKKKKVSRQKVTPSQHCPASSGQVGEAGTQALRDSDPGRPLLGTCPAASRDSGVSSEAGPWPHPRPSLGQRGPSLEEGLGDPEGKLLPAVWDTGAQSLGGEDPLEDGTMTHSSIRAWRIPWTEQPDELQAMWSQRVGHD